MKLSINKISIIFAIFVIGCIAYIQSLNREEYLVQNSFQIKNHTYANNFVLNINNHEISNRANEEYNRILYGLFQNSYDINFQTEKDEIILYSPYYVIHFFYNWNGRVILNQINITTTKKNYCEN